MGIDRGKVYECLRGRNGREGVYGEAFVHISVAVLISYRCYYYYCFRCTAAQIGMLGVL